MPSVHWLSVVLLFAVVVSAQAYPWSRQKRVSDQRLAELETLLTLARLKGKLVTVPIGFGLIDPAKIGRRKRSEGSASTVEFELPKVEMISIWDDVTSGEDDPTSSSVKLRRDLQNQDSDEKQRMLRNFLRDESSGLHKNH